MTSDLIYLAAQQHARDLERLAAAVRANDAGTRRSRPFKRLSKRAG